MAGSSIEASRVVVRIGMAVEIPVLAIGEPGWDIDFKRMRMGDGTPTPPMIMSTKSTGIFKFDFITYVEYPQINMLPEGTVDGVDISDLNQTNGYVVRRGDNLWAQRTFQNTDGYIAYINPAGTAGDTVINFSDAFKTEISTFLKTVAVDDVTIHGDGRTINPLFAQTATKTLKGVARLATSAETIQGVDDATIVTPADLQSKKTSQSVFGIVRLSTQAEVDAATDLTTAVSPGLLKHYVDGHGLGSFQTVITNSQQFSFNGGKSVAPPSYAYPTFFRIWAGVLATVTSGGSPNGDDHQSQISNGYIYAPLRIQINGQVHIDGDGIGYSDVTYFNGTLWGVNGFEFTPIQSINDSTDTVMIAGGGADASDEFPMQFQWYRRQSLTLPSS